MAEFTFFCSRCGKSIQCDTGYCGAEINCPACQQIITVPQPLASSVPQPTLKYQRKSLVIPIAITASVIIVVLVGLFLYMHSHSGGLAASWSWNGSSRESLHGSKGVGHGQVNYADGMGGRVLELSGDGYLTIPGSDDLNIGKANGMTIECWIKLKGFNQGPVIEWSAANVSSTGDGVQMWASDRLFANLLDTSHTPHPFQCEPGILKTNVFQLVAVTYDKASGEAKLYIDGKEVASKDFGEMTPQTAYPKISIGRRISQPIGLGSNFNGLIGELRLYRRALSESEIMAAYNAGKTRE